MPRGKYVNHKGRSRHFTNPDDLERERKLEQQQGTKWRNKKEEDESSEEEEAVKEASGSESEGSESGSDDDTAKKAKGVEGLIEIENPNRVVRKSKKLNKLDEGQAGDQPNEATATPGAAAASTKVSFASQPKPELSRREREELEKQRAKAHYQKLHAEGKTDEARADLARLALVRKQREEAAKKREDEKKAKEAVSQAKKEQTGKALGR